MKKIILLILLVIIITTGCKSENITDSKVIDTLNSSDKVIVRLENDKERSKVINNEEIIKNITEYFSNAIMVKDFTTLEGNTYIAEFYNDDELKYSIKIWTDGYIGFQSKEYEIENEKKTDFLNIIIQDLEENK